MSPVATDNPDELTAVPLTLWLAPIGTAFPTLDTATPPVDWIKLGKEGNLNYDEDGVTVTPSQTLEFFTPAGSTFPRKAFRTEEGLVMEFNLADTSVAQVALVLDRATVTTVAAGASVTGNKKISLKRGLDVEQYALLGRGQSPEDNTLTMQHEWPTVVMSSEELETVHNKGVPAMLPIEFTALEVVKDQVGDLRVGTTPPTA